jgi:hypothetical protein
MPILLFIGSIMGILGGLVFLKYKLHKCHNNNIEHELINNNIEREIINNNNIIINDDTLPKYEDIIKNDDDILPDY